MEILFRREDLLLHVRLLLPDTMQEGFHYNKFDELVAPYGFSWKLRDIMPKALVAGEDAGVPTEEGAKLLDVTGKLKAGIPMCPPEGDAGTGMAVSYTHLGSCAEAGCSVL